MKKYVLLFLLMTSACVGTSQTSKFYTLKSFAESKGRVVYVLKTNIGVQEITLPDYLDRPQMVTSNHNSMEFKFSEFHRWNDSLDLIFQRVLTEDLSMYFPKSQVGAQETGRENFKYLVAVDVIQFDGSLGKTAVLDAKWTLKTSGGTVLAEERSRFEMPVGGTYLDLATTESELIEKLSQAIAARLSAVAR